MPNTQNNPYLIDEADIPKNWEPIEAEPTIPGAAAAAMAATPSMPPYYRGSIDSNLEHDAQFVATDRTPRVTSIPLMPIAPSGNPQNNAAIQSIIKINQTAAAISALSDMIFRGVWNPLTSYAIGNVVLFNESAYVAITGSVGLQPDLNSTNWTLLSENLVFNPTISSLVSSIKFGPIDGASTGAGGNGGPISCGITPSVAGDLVFLLTSFNDNPQSPLTGWVSIFNHDSFQDGNTFSVFSNSGSASVGSSLGDATIAGEPFNWGWIMTAFQSEGFSLTGTLTSVAVSSDVLTCQCANHFTVGTQVRFPTGLNASFLDSQVVTITSASTTGFTAAFTHANYGPSPESATIANLPYLQEMSVSSGVTTPTFTNTVKNGSLIVIIALTGDSNGNCGINSVSDSSGNHYTIVHEGGSGGGAGVAIAFSQGVIGGPLQLNLNISVNDPSAYSFVAFEFPGSESGTTYFYQPYDVLQFRGSMWVCLAETTEDPYTNPANWGLMAQGMGTVDVETSGYLATATDSGRLISFNSSSPVTLTLPNPAPELTAPESSGWWISVENTGTGALTIDPNSLLIDGSGSSLTLQQNQGVAIFTDGTNYYTMRGLGSSGTVTSVAAQFTGGLISVSGSPITSSGTLDFTVAGTPGGIPYFTDGTEYTPTGLTFAVVHTDDPGNVYPSSLVQFTDPFTSSSSLTVFTESGFTSATVTVTGGTATVAMSGKQEAILAETSSSFSMPQLMVVNHIDSVSAGATGFNDTGVGIIKDVNNYLFAIYDQVNKVALVSIRVAGTLTLLGQTSVTLTAPFRLGMSLVNDSVTIWADTGSGFAPINLTGTGASGGSVNVSSYYDFAVAGNLTGYMAATLTSENGGSSTWVYSGFGAGNFGTVCTRDMTLVVNKDGSPYNTSGGVTTLSATCTDPVGSGYCGIFQYNLNTNVLTQVGVLMVKRSSYIYGDLNAAVVVDGSTYRVLMATWGNGFGGAINVEYEATATNVLSGANILSGMSNLSLPGVTGMGYINPGSYDPMMYYDSVNSRWQIAYVITKDTSFTGSPFFAASAYSPDLATWTLIGADTANEGYEGAKIIQAAGAYWIAVGGPAGSGNSSRVYDASMTFVGSLNAIFNGGSQTQPHPMVFGVGNTEYLITFDNHQYGSTSFTWGNWIVETATRYSILPGAGWASSAELTENAVVVGGGLVEPPFTIPVDNTATHALFATATGAPAFRAIMFSDLPGGGSSGAGHITILPLSYSAIGQGTWVTSLLQNGSSPFNVLGFLPFQFYNSSATNGDNISFQIDLDTGTYTFMLLCLTNNDHGIANVLIDGSSVGTIDNYSASLTYNVRQTITGISTTAGLHTLKLALDGKNGSSSNYYLSIIYLAFWRTA